MPSEPTGLIPRNALVANMKAADRRAYLKGINDPFAATPEKKVKNILKSFPVAAAPTGAKNGPQLPPLGLFDKRLFEYTEHAFGHFAPVEPNAVGPIDIVDAGSMEPDASLKGQRIKVTLDRLRVADYPGGGLHRVMVSFHGEHQVEGGSKEPLQFNQQFRVQEGQGAGARGYPIFVGLKVGEEGVAFKAFTVNVSNDDDAKALGFLESAPFSSGLQLLTTANPAIAPLTGVATGLVKMLLRRNENRPVQDIYLGLDLSNIGSRAKLAQGTYVAVQIPDKFAQTWRWTDWVFNPKLGTLSWRDDPSIPIPYNYLAFSVSKYGG